MTTNILDKIYEIMIEYESMLDSNGNIVNKNLKNFKNIFTKDTFFNYIFEKIKIEKKNAEMEVINENNSSNKEYINFVRKNNEKPLDFKQNNGSELILINPSLTINNIKIELSSENEINKFFKKCYKKIILKSHPDKNGEPLLFIKSRKYYEEKLLIGILYICYILKIGVPDFNEKIVEHILFEIRIIQEKIISAT